MPDISVVILSSHSLFREGLKHILIQATGINLVGFAQSIEEIEGFIEREKLDAIIVEQLDNDPVDTENISRWLVTSGLRVITVSLEDAGLKIYSREQVGEASAETLIAALKAPEIKGD